MRLRIQRLSVHHGKARAFHVGDEEALGPPRDDRDLDAGLAQGRERLGELELAPGVAAGKDLQRAFLSRLLPELLALARKQPGKLSYGTTSVNYIIHFGQWLTRLGKADMLAVAYKNPAQQMQDVLSGRIQAIITSPPTLEPHLKAGKLRVVAVDGDKRYPGWPDTPTVAETFPGFRLSGVGVLVGPRGVPREVVSTLHGAMERIVTSKDYQQTLLKMGFTVENAGTPESIRELLRERRTYWKQVFDGLGVKPE